MIVFPSIMLPMFLAVLDQTIVAAALPAIAADLGDPAHVSWIVIAYLIAAVAVLPVYGWLGDLLGRKRLMVIGLVILLAASLACAMATSVLMLTLGRVAQGLGAGGLQAMSQALVGEVMPPRDRVRYQGFLASIGVFATIFGAVIGGLLTEYFGWRSIFLVTLPIGLVALLLLRRLPARTMNVGRFQFDFAGLLLFVTFITALLLAVHQVQTLAESWRPIAVLLLVAVAAAVALLRVEKRAAQPLFPAAVFLNPGIRRCDGLALCHGAALVSMITFVPICLRVVSGDSAGTIGLLLAPIAMSVPFGSTLTGLLVARTGRTAIFPSIGLLVASSAIIAAAIALPRLNDIGLAAFLTLATVFMGTVMSVVQVTVQTAAGPAMLGVAAASVQFSRSIGAALGTAVVGGALFATLALVDPRAGELFLVILQKGPDVLATLPDAERALVRSEIAGAFRVAFFANAAFTLIGCALAWSIPTRRL